MEQIGVATRLLGQHNSERMSHSVDSPLIVTCIHTQSDTLTDTPDKLDRQTAYIPIHANHLASCHGMGNKLHDKVTLSLSLSLCLHTDGPECTVPVAA